MIGLIHNHQNPEDSNTSDKISDILERLYKCRNELEGIKDSMFKEEYSKVRKELGCAISACNRAGKELHELKPMEGQMDIFSMLEDYERD